MVAFTDRQREIVDTAVNIIAQKGIQQLTIKNISKSMGISEPAIYRHFRSKLDILLAILANFQDSTKTSLRRVQSIDKTPVKKIETIFTTHIIRFSANPALAATIFSEEIFQNDVKLATKVAAIMELSQVEIEKLIKKGQQINEIRDDVSERHLATMIIGSLRLLVTRWRLSRFSFDLEMEGTNLWQAIEKLVAQHGESNIKQ